MSDAVPLPLFSFFVANARCGSLSIFTFTISFAHSVEWKPLDTVYACFIPLTITISHDIINYFIRFWCALCCAVSYQWQSQIYKGFNSHERQTKNRKHKKTKQPCFSRACVCAVQMDFCRLNPKWFTIIWKRSNIRDGIGCDVLR